MRAIVAKRLRREAQGSIKLYLYHHKTGQTILDPHCWRANYQQLKKWLKIKHGTA